jgi:hypothetical protein
MHERNGWLKQGFETQISQIKARITLIFFVPYSVTSIMSHGNGYNDPNSASGGIFGTTGYDVERELRAYAEVARLR